MTYRAVLPHDILSEENGEAAARAIVCMDGAVHEAEKRASVTGLATLDYKRTITELVKRLCTMQSCRFCRRPRSGEA